MAKVIDIWVNEEYLEKIDGCIYMLGNRYPEARESLIVAGEISVKAAERGRKRKIARTTFQRLEQQQKVGCYLDPGGVLVVWPGIGRTSLKASFPTSPKPATRWSVPLSDIAGLTGGPRD